MTIDEVERDRIEARAKAKAEADAELDKRLSQIEFQLSLFKVPGGALLLWLLSDIYTALKAGIGG